MSDRSSALDATVSGLHFAALQIGSFLAVESVSSSAWSTYATLTGAWLLGTLGGMWAKLPLRPAVVAGVLAFEALVALTRVAPWSRTLVPFAAAATGIGGLWAGGFFARAARRRSIQGVFFHENNGFVAGLVLTPLTFALGGRVALAALPLVTAVALLCTSARSFRRQST